MYVFGLFPFVACFSWLLGMVLVNSSKLRRQASLRNGDGRVEIGRCQVQRILINGVVSEGGWDMYQSELLFTFLDDPLKKLQKLRHPPESRTMLAVYGLLTRYVPDGTPFEYGFPSRKIPYQWVPTKAPYAINDVPFPEFADLEFVRNHTWLDNPRPIVEVRYVHGDFLSNDWNLLAESDRSEIMGWKTGVTAVIGIIAFLAMGVWGGASSSQILILIAVAALFVVLTYHIVRKDFFIAPIQKGPVAKSGMKFPK